MFVSLADSRFFEFAVSLGFSILGALRSWFIESIICLYVLDAIFAMQGPVFNSKAYTSLCLVWTDVMDGCVG